MQTVQHASQRGESSRATARPQSPKTLVGNRATAVDHPVSRPESAIGSRNGAAKPGGQEVNRLLGALSPREYTELLRHSELMTLGHGHVVYERGVPTTDVYFPQTAVFSMVREMKRMAPASKSARSDETAWQAPACSPAPRQCRPAASFRFRAGHTASR